MENDHIELYTCHCHQFDFEEINLISRSRSSDFFSMVINGTIFFVVILFLKKNMYVCRQEYGSKENTLNIFVCNFDHKHTQFSIHCDSSDQQNGHQCFG